MTAARPPRRITPIVALNVVLWTIVLVLGGWWGIRALLDYLPTARTAPRFDPPVWAGQNVPGACSGGFYARHDQTVVITIVAHCAASGTELRDVAGRLIGVFGPSPRLADCPAGRICSPSDFLTLALAPEHIPWGHLNVVDLGAGGYRTIEAGTRPLACGDIDVGARVETNGRERYRTGSVLQVAPYDFETDVIFPCMAVADIPVAVGDSGAAVLVDGRPAGIIARQMDTMLGFTPLAEGLEHLGLTLCTTPDCDLEPETAVQPTD